MVAVDLVLPLQGCITPRTDGEAGVPAGAGLLEATDLGDVHRLLKVHLLHNVGGDEQIVGRQVKAHADLFQSQNGGSGLAPNDAAKIPGTDMALLGGSFVAEFAGLTDVKEIGG